MGRKSKIHLLEDATLKQFSTDDKGITTKGISLKMQISWNTADKLLKILKDRNKLSCKRYGRVNVWTRK